MDAARVVREARGRAGLTQRALAHEAGTLQPAVARIESGDVVPRVDTLSRLLAVCGARLAVEARPSDSGRWATIRSDIQPLLRSTPRQRLLSIPRRAGSKFQPLQMIKALAFRRVGLVLVGEIAARAHGAPLTPGVVEIAVHPERLNSERLARALEAMAGPFAPRKGLPAGLRDLRGRGRIRTRFGTITCWWPPYDTYRRLEAAATEMPLATRPVLVASIDDLIERWPKRGDELELLALVREEIDARAVLARRRRART